MNFFLLSTHRYGIVPDTLPVYLNRESLHSLEVPTGIETDGSFEVLLVNHGAAVHVHLHLDDALSGLASIDATNHYVQAESERSVKVTIKREGAVRGRLKVVTGYGAETRYADVDIVESEESEQSVQVDESLGTPQPREASVDDSSGLLTELASPVYLLAGLAMVSAGIVAVAVPSTAVRVGSVIVLLTVLAGLVMTQFD